MLTEIVQRVRPLVEAAVPLRTGPTRTLDVDILLVDGVTVGDADLQIPHPQMRERRFVLEALRDLAPELVPTLSPEWSDRIARGDQ